MQSRGAHFQGRNYSDIVSLAHAVMVRLQQEELRYEILLI